MSELLPYQARGNAKPVCVWEETAHAEIHRGKGYMKMRAETGSSYL